MYNNPGFYGMGPMYYGNIAPKVGLLSRLKGGINWGNFLTNTSKTLNVINQAIPIVYQVKPLFQNVKTLAKIANIIKSDDKEVPNNTLNKTKSHPMSAFSYQQVTSESTKKEEPISSNQPTFFL